MAWVKLVKSLSLGAEFGYLLDNDTSLESIEGTPLPQEEELADICWEDDFDLLIKLEIGIGNKI